MDAALGHLVFSMKYDVIGDQEHLRLMLRYNVLLSLYVTCFLSHLCIFSPSLVSSVSQTSSVQYPLQLSFTLFSLLLLLSMTLFSHWTCNNSAYNIHVWHLFMFYIEYTHKCLDRAKIARKKSISHHLTVCLVMNF